MDNILSKEAAVPRPPHQRFHITLGKRRTTVSIDDSVAVLLAACLGEDPGSRQATARVRAWLQERAAEGPAGAGLNRRLFRRTVLEIADKELSKRCAAFLPETGERTRATPPAPGSAAVASPPSPPSRFVLYRATPGLAPEIVVRGVSVEDIRSRAADVYAEDDARPAVVGAALITTEKERAGRYYIRRCSEDVWAMLVDRREIRPVLDSSGVWHTRREMAQRRKATAWRDALQTMAKPRRKTG
jgi:hypothetical protein